MKNLTDLTIIDALKKLKSGEITATQLTQAYLDRIEKFNAELNCYITVTPERALADAAESDARYAAGNTLPLDGIPIGMKDLFATVGIRTTAASHILENFIPEYESTISQKLINAGTVLLGKTNMDEFAMSGTGKTSYFGATVNPYKRELRLGPGGSSSGSAAAVAGGLAMCATGSDTGDSIRRPSSLTGLVGFKPTYGVCSRFGCFAFGSSLDHPGPITRTVDDAALLMSAMAGYEPRESTSATQADDIAKSLSEPLTALPLKNIKIGIVRELKSNAVSDDMKSVMAKHLDSLRNLGVEIIDVSIPHIMNTETLYCVISRAEASSNLARYDGMRYGIRTDGSNLEDTYKKTRAAGFGENVKFRMVTGSVMLSEKFYKDCYLQAAKCRKIMDNEFITAFENCDFIMTPSATNEAITLDLNLTAAENEICDAMLVSSNMSGLPACSVPGGLSSNGLPLGLHIIGRRFDDKRVLQMAKHIEEFTNLDNKPSTVMGE